MKLLSSCLILASLLLVSQAQVSAEDQKKFQDCGVKNCVDEVAVALQGTQAQKDEYYKYHKCSLGSKNDDDTKDVAAAITHHEKCKTMTTLTLYAECSETCAKIHISESNPYAKVTPCMDKCARDSDSTNTAYSQVLGFSVVLLALLFALI